jgi:DNA-binding IclR family transcriptional regulator
VLSGGPERTWTENEIAAAAGLSPKNTVRRHIAVLVQAGLLVGAPGAYRLNAGSRLIAALEPLLRQLDGMPADALPPSRGGMPTGSP